MCGILGAVSSKGPLNRVDFNCWRDLLAHRGPDDSGSQFFEQDRVALGHRRLSFLDLSVAGRQPLSNEDESVWITLNGEIYNYVELRKELQMTGHTFRTLTDTEVILHGYEQWGREVLSRLTGMFAFGILDLRSREIFLARDRFGIKPLYYSLQPDRFLFASELKAIVASPLVHRELDISALADYLVYRYVPSPKSIWKGVCKLPPAHSMVYSIASGKVAIMEYWKIPFANKRVKSEVLIEGVDRLLARSVANHARSDVPVGSLLSGGYDSSAIVYSLIRAGYRPDTFSIGFQDWGESEHRYAAAVAEHLGVPLSCRIVEDLDLELLSIMPIVYDEPIADISILPTWLVCNLAAGQVKAVMSGEGADELFGGYWWPKTFVASTKPSNWKARLRSIFKKSEVDTVGFYADAMAMGRFDRKELEKFFPPDCHRHLPADPDWFYRKHLDSRLSPLKRIQRLDIKCFMGELVLTKVDRASMANSLEVRVPFLDHKLYELVLNASENSYFRSEIAKFPLYENIKSHLPDQIMSRPKQGFVGPDEFYRKLSRYRAILDGSRLVKDGLLRKEYVSELFENDDFWRLWKVAVLETWYRHWIS